MKILLGLSFVSIAFLIFQILFPYRPPKHLEFSTIVQNKNKYNRLEMWSILFIFLSVAFICFGVFIIGSQMREIFFSSKYEYILTPTNTFWFFPGIILGFGLIRVPMEFVYKLILKEEYYLYTQHTNMKHGFDGEKIWKPFEYILTFAGIIIFALGLNWFIRVDTNQKIEINELFSLKTHTYSLSDISEIRHQETHMTKRGIEKKIPNYTIEFNGYEWNSYVYGFFSAEKDFQRLDKKIEKISNLRGIEIIYSPTVKQSK